MQEDWCWELNVVIQAFFFYDTISLLLKGIWKWSDICVKHVKRVTCIESQIIKWEYYFTQELRIIRKLRTAMDFSFFIAVLSRGYDLLSRYLDITKIIFSW